MRRRPVYGDYLEQLTYLLFLKMADEQTPWRRPSPVPEGYDWPGLTARDGADLEQHERLLLEHRPSSRARRAPLSTGASTT